MERESLAIQSTTFVRLTGDRWAHELESERGGLIKTACGQVRPWSQRIPLWRNLPPDRICPHCKAARGIRAQLDLPMTANNEKEA